MRWFFVPVRDDEGKVIGYFERHEMHWDFSDPGKPVAVPKLKQDIKTCLLYTSDAADEL